tara:strand:+ start:274 stop:1992 length:1719 start_codon:yes stop_codon:yes gene_type:complete
MLSKKKQVKHGGCIPPNLKRALQLAKGMDDSTFKTWFGNGCNQVCTRTVPHVAIKMLSCQQKHDMYLDITGYDLLFNHFFNENGATFSTILSEDEINGEANNWTFTGSFSLNKDRFFDRISQNNHIDCPVKLFYNEPKYTADETLEVLMMDSDFLLHVCDALIDEDEDAYVAFTIDKNVNAYFKKVHVVRAIDNVLKKKGKDFLFPVTNKKNKKLLKQCIEETLENVEESSSSDEDSSEESSSDEKEYVIVVTDNTELYPGLLFLPFMRDKLPATTDTDKKTTGISAVKFANAMVIPIASKEPWNRCEISNIFVPSVHEDGVYYVLSGKRWKKTRLTSKHIDVSNHGSSSSKTSTQANDDGEKDQQVGNTTTTTTTVVSNVTEEEEAKAAAEAAKKEEVRKAAEKAAAEAEEEARKAEVRKAAEAAKKVEEEKARKAAEAKKKIEEEEARKAAAKKVEEEEAKKAAEKAAEAAKKVEEEEAEKAAEKAAAVKKRKAAAASKRGRKKKKKKTWTMPETVEEIPLWKKRNKKDLIAKQLSSDGTCTYWIKNKEKRVWEEYTNDNDFMQSYLDMW